MNRRAFLAATATTTAALSLSVLSLAEAADGLRTVEVLRDGAWTPTPWEDLVEGSVFRLRESTGEIVDEGAEHEVSIALSDAQYTGAPGYWGVECEPYEVKAAA